jgi:hypothetical protein
VLGSRCKADDTARMLASVILARAWTSCARCPLRLQVAVCLQLALSAAVSASRRPDDVRCGACRTATWADVVRPTRERSRFGIGQRPAIVARWMARGCTHAGDETAEKTTGRFSTVRPGLYIQSQAAPQPNSCNAQCHPRRAGGEVRPGLGNAWPASKHWQSRSLRFMLSLTLTAPRRASCAAGD